MDESFERFLDEELPGLLRLAGALTGNRALAEEIVQDTLLKATRRWPQIAVTSSPGAYLRRMLVNEHITWRRKWSRLIPYEVVPAECVGPDHAEQLATRDLLARMLDRLPPKQRAVLVLRYYEDHDDVAIAAILGCSPGTVRSHASRALATLRITSTRPLAVACVDETREKETDMPTTQDLAALLAERAANYAPDQRDVLAALGNDQTALLARADDPLARAPRRHGYRVLATAATVVAALGIGVGVNMLYSRNDGAAVPGGAPIAACPVALPAAWQQALANNKVSEPGTNVQPLAVTNGGAVIMRWTDRNGVLHVGRRDNAQSITPLAEIDIPVGAKVGTVAATARYAVASFYRHDRTSAIDLLNLANGRTRQLLPTAPLATQARTAGGSWLTIQHSTVYWPASGRNSEPNVLVSYNITSGRYHSKPVPGDAVYLNAVGIYWEGGHLTKVQFPRIHPPLEQRYMSAATDADAFAWSLYSDPTTLTWSDRTGTARTLRQHLAHFLYIDAVAGPYVFLDRGEGDDSDTMNGNIHVLDTRTGAIADTSTNQWEWATSTRGTLTFTTIPPHAAMRVINVADLPELRCR